jgi:hypothetical protein
MLRRIPTEHYSIVQFAWSRNGLLGSELTRPPLYILSEKNPDFIRGQKLHSDIELIYEVT